MADNEVTDLRSTLLKIIDIVTETGEKNKNISDSAKLSRIALLATGAEKKTRQWLAFD